MTITVTVTSAGNRVRLHATRHQLRLEKLHRCQRSGDATTGVRALAAEKQNYANWYQYHRTRMKTAKAGGSEAFATLDENYRVGIMGLYPSGSRQQVIGGIRRRGRSHCRRRGKPDQHHSG